MRAFGQWSSFAEPHRRAARLRRSLRLTNQRGQHLDLQCLVWSNRASEMALAAGICLRHCLPSTGYLSKDSLID